MRKHIFKAICLAVALAVATPSVAVPTQAAATASYDKVFVKSRSGSIYYYVRNAPVKGEHVIDGYRYFFDITTGKMQTGWIQTAGKTKYAQSNGRLYVSTTQGIGGKAYTFDSEGAVVSGGAAGGTGASAAVAIVRKFTVTFKDGYSGAVLKSQNVVSGGAATAPIPAKYPGYKFAGWDRQYSRIAGNTTVTATYVNSDGFYKIGGKTYYYKNGKMLKKCLKKIGKHKYYFDKNGVMAVNKSVKIKGKTHYFDKKGHKVTSKKAIKKVKKAIKKAKSSAKKKSTKKKTSKKSTKKKTSSNITSTKTGKVALNGKIKTTKEEIIIDKSGNVVGRVMGIPYIMQSRGVWTGKKNSFIYGDKYVNYGIVEGHTVATNGCGISSCAMAISALTGKLVLPNKLASTKYGFNGRGSDGNVAKKAAKKFGLHAKVYKSLTKKQLISHLLKGRYVVVGINHSCYGGGGDNSGGNSATGGGHYVLIHGYKNGKFAIADPNNTSQTYVYSKNLKSYSTFNSHLGNFAGVDKGKIGVWNYGVIWK